MSEQQKQESQTSTNNDNESTKNLNSIFKIAQDLSNLTQLITYDWNQICQIQELYSSSDRDLGKSQIC